VTTAVMPTKSIGKNSRHFCTKPSDSHVFQTGHNCLPDRTELADVHLMYLAISSYSNLFKLETASSDELLNLSSSLGSFSNSETALAF
jgi:hypothetical protein